MTSEESEVRGARELIGNDAVVVGASIDAGGPNLGGVFKPGAHVEFNNMIFRVTMAEGAVMLVQFVGFSQTAQVGGV